MYEYSQVATAVIVVLAAVMAANACFTLFDHIKRAKKPDADLAATVESHGRMLSNDDRRINEISSGVNLLLKSNMQLLNHAVHGNHIDQMAETHDEIQDYLINR